MIDSECSSYPVVTDIFEGPLDLLLHLIRKHEIDIYDIPIADIAVQYNKYLDILRDIDIDMAGEYLVMAATLVYLKSKSLLPDREEDGVAEDDEQEELVRNIEEFQRYQAVADILREKEASRTVLWSRPDPLAEQFAPPQSYNVDADLLDLVEAFRELLKDRTDLVNLSQEEFSVEDKIIEIMDFLKDSKSVNFRNIFSEMKSKIEMIVLFLALLELIKLGVIRAYQSRKSGEIRIYKKNEESFQKTIGEEGNE